MRTHSTLYAFVLADAQHTHTHTLTYSLTMPSFLHQIEGVTKVYIALFPPLDAISFRSLGALLFRNFLQPVSLLWQSKTEICLVNFAPITHTHSTGVYVSKAFNFDNQSWMSEHTVHIHQSANKLNMCENKLKRWHRLAFFLSVFCCKKKSPYFDVGRHVIRSFSKVNLFRFSFTLNKDISFVIRFGSRCMQNRFVFYFAWV